MILEFCDVCARCPLQLNEQNNAKYNVPHRNCLMCHSFIDACGVLRLPTLVLYYNPLGRITLQIQSIEHATYAFTRFYQTCNLVTSFDG